MAASSEEVSRRATWLVFSARFADELLSAPLSVLTPTFRRVFDLSLVQVGLLMQVLEWVALVVEPVAATLIDLRSRRVLLAFGATCVGLSILMLGMASSYAMLLVGFAVYGLGSGPLAHTADVVVVELHAAHPERAYARATFLDTLGALLSPGALAVAAATGVSWRVVLVGFGLSGLLYAAAIAATAFPAPRPHDTATRLARQPEPLDESLVAMAESVLRFLSHAAAGGAALGDAKARRWLLVLLAFDLVEATAVLEFVWLNEEVGLDQGWVAAYAAGEMAVGLVALAWLDRWLDRHDSGDAARRALVAAALALAVLYPAWVLAPGVAGRVVVGIPLAFAMALIWPIAKSRSLVSVPGRAGAVQAVTTLFGVIPMAVVFTRLAEVIGIGPAMIAFTVPGALLLAWLASRAELSRGGGI